MLSSTIPNGHSYILSSRVLRQQAHRRVFASLQVPRPTILRTAPKAVAVADEAVSTAPAGTPRTIGTDSAAAFADDVVSPIGRRVTLPNLTATDPGLQSTWGHRAWVTAGCSSILFSLSKSLTYSPHTPTYIAESLLLAFLGYFLADLGSGVYHWGIDNYGDASTPIFGSQIEAFQGHHRWPWTITRRQFANNLHSLAKVIFFAMLPLDVAVNDPLFHAFAGVFSGCILFSQQFHAWAHGTKSRLPGPVVTMQDAGLLVSRQMHGDHHRPPYNGNYCIVSGMWNGFLDRYRVFEAAEMLIYFRWRIRPRSWQEPEPEWQELVDPTAEFGVQAGNVVD